MTTTGETSVPSERRAASWMAVGTLLSRITGFVRTAALLAVTGVTQLGNAYNTANTVPNMLLFLVTGGTISAVFIPMLAREEDLDRRRHVAETIGGLIILLTGAASVAMLLTAPLVARLFALNVVGDSAAFVSVTTQWLALFAPQILCYGVSVYAVAVLNAHGRLALAGFAPIATNVVAIGAAYLYAVLGAPQPPDVARLTTVPLVVLGVGTTLSVAAMALPQLLGARRVLPGLRLRPRARFSDPAARQLWRLGRWTLLYVAVNQVGLFVVVTLANGVDGGTVAYQTAFAIMQLPFAIVAVSLFSAIYPRLSRAAGKPDGLFGATVSGGLRLSNALLIPAAVGLYVLAEPVADLLVGYGAARGAGADFVATALRVFAVALTPFTVFQLLTRSYYAFPDTRTPALANIAVNVVNVAAAFAAFAVFDDPRTQVAGLVGAYALSYVTGCLLLGTGLVRRRPGSFAGAMRGTLTALAASAAMA
ncbi:MAG: murein biosynthesis integral membrane protein MurJ, partial [Euzebyales bacterium]|nr:murein biosynthesis integral membrane protein MurJ [Euzebyales bacterium]